MSVSGLSLSVITRDDESTIGRVLEDVGSLCDELVVIDTGSVDSTVEVARHLGARVISYQWDNDFAAARNFAFSNCNGEWILAVEADDRISPASREGLSRIYKEVLPRSDVDCVVLPYRDGYAGDDPDRYTVSVNRARLFRKHGDLTWTNAVHETVALELERTLLRDDVWIEHRPLPEQLRTKADRNLELLEETVGRGDRSGVVLQHLGVELSRHGRFDEAFKIFEEALAASLDTDHRYDVLCAQSDCAKELDRDRERVRALMQAMALDSRRAEAFVLLGTFYFERRRWRQAMPFFVAATVLERPTDCLGSIFEPAYTWLPWDFLSVCANQIGDYGDALRYTYRALPGNPERDRLLANLQLNWNDLDELHGDLGLHVAAGARHLN